MIARLILAALCADLAEESRRANDLLRECKDALLACKTMLELIRNESRMR